MRYEYFGWKKDKPRAEQMTSSLIVLGLLSADSLILGLSSMALPHRTYFFLDFNALLAQIPSDENSPAPFTAFLPLCFGGSRTSLSRNTWVGTFCSEKGSQEQGIPTFFWPNAYEWWCPYFQMFCVAFSQPCKLLSDFACSLSLRKCGLLTL